MNSKKNKKIEFGDWQTPQELTDIVCKLIANNNVLPKSVIEPTCGKGSFILSAIKKFPTLKYCTGIDISEQYLADILEKIKPFSKKINTNIIQADIFSFSWEKHIKAIPEPILVIGNPPWVTNSTISSISGGNLPKKLNFQKHKGIEAITGKGNFDISESIIITMLENLKGKDAYFAMLCKTSVARKILYYTHKNHIAVDDCKIYKIDSKKYFNAAVDACLLCLRNQKVFQPVSCEIYEGPNSEDYTLASFRKNRFIANIKLYEKWKHLFENEKTSLRWRSGIKHDCAKVMELKKIQEGIFENGFKEKFQLEDKYLFPMLKSSDLANGKIETINRYMITPQTFVGEATDKIKKNAPNTWNYLQKYSELLDRRTSTIYKKKPQFSIFGTGDYTFSEWKIAISGLYKNMKFRLIGPYQGKPVVFDDTCYALKCQSQEQAELIYSLLTSETAKEFYSAYIWWDTKRPVTLEILNMLNINKLADFVENCNNKGYQKEKLCKRQYQLTMF